MIKIILYAFILLSIALFNGCSSLKKIIDPPKVILENVKINKMTIAGVALDIFVIVENPNNIDFEVKNLTYTLDVNEKTVTSGKVNDKILVQAKRKTTVIVPITLKYSDILSSAIMFLNSEAMPYKIKGNAEIGPFSIPFNRSGNLNSTELNKKN